MSTSQYGRVEFDFAGRELVGTVVDYLEAADISGPDGLLVVDVDGERYRVEESRAECPDR